MRPRLRILSGVRAGETILLQKPRFTIGRHHDADLSLADPKVSGQHAVITARNHAHFIEDSSSMNGTTVEAEPIRGRRPLGHGDRVGTGGIVSVYLIEEDEGTLDPKRHLVEGIPIAHPRTILMERRRPLLGIVVE